MKPRSKGRRMAGRKQLLAAEEADDSENDPSVISGSASGAVDLALAGLQAQSVSHVRNYVAKAMLLRSQEEVHS